MLYYKQMPQYADKQTVTSLLYFKAKNSADFLIYFTQIFLQTFFFSYLCKRKEKQNRKLFSISKFKSYPKQKTLFI